MLIRQADFITIFERLERWGWLNNNIWITTESYTLEYTKYHKKKILKFVFTLSGNLKYLHVNKCL